MLCQRQISTPISTIADDGLGAVESVLDILDACLALLSIIHTNVLTEARAALVSSLACKVVVRSRTGPPGTAHQSLSA